MVLILLTTVGNSLKIPTIVRNLGMQVLLRHSQTVKFGDRMSLYNTSCSSCCPIFIPLAVMEKWTEFSSVSSLKLPFEVPSSFPWIAEIAQNIPARHLSCGAAHLLYLLHYWMSYTLLTFDGNALVSSQTRMQSRCSLHMIMRSPNYLQAGKAVPLLTCDVSRHIEGVICRDQSLS